MRATTGMKRGIGHDSLYFDTGLEQLSERKKRQKLTIFYKMINQLVPRILCELIPETTGEMTTYTLRSCQNTSLMKTSIKALQTSFISLTVKKWNLLRVSMRGLGTLEQFKQEITSKLNKLPPYFYDGKRKLQILHTRIRMQCSDLHEDLFIKGLAGADVGDQIEDVKHYLIHCTNYQEFQDNLTYALDCNIFGYDIDILLYGDGNIGTEANRNIFKVVQCVIEFYKLFK